MDSIWTYSFPVEIFSFVERGNAFMRIDHVNSLQYKLEQNLLWFQLINKNQLKAEGNIGGREFQNSSFDKTN